MREDAGKVVRQKIRDDLRKFYKYAGNTFTFNEIKDVRSRLNDAGIATSYEYGFWWIRLECGDVIQCTTIHEMTGVGEEILDG